MLIDKKAWYALSVTGGKEIKTRDWLVENKSKFNVSDDVLDEVFLPIQKKVSVVRGKKKIYEKSLIGPYLFVHANITNENVINFFSQAPNVYNFVGNKSGGFRSGADLISDEEINKLKHIEENGNLEENKDLSIGDNIEIISGNFSNFKGVVTDINTKTNILKVSVMIFGGENIIEVQTSCVKKIANYE